MTTYTLSEARKHFPEIIEKSHSLFEEFVISKKGRPAAVIVDYELFASMKETLSIVLNQKLAKKLRQAREDLKHGHGKSWKTLREELEK